MGLFNFNKITKTYLQHTEGKHTYEVKGGIKNFLYVDGVECDFGWGDLSYDEKGLHVEVRIEGGTMNLFVNDVLVKHVKL